MKIQRIPFPYCQSILGLTSYGEWWFQNEAVGITHRFVCLSSTLNTNPKYLQEIGVDLKVNEKKA